MPLQTVRPFVFRDLNLFEESQIDKRKPKSKEKVNKFCCDIVQQMLDQAKLQHTGHPVSLLNYVAFLLSLAHVGRVGLVRLQAKELCNFHRPKPQVCGSEWGGILGAVKNVATRVGC